MILNPESLGKIYLNVSQEKGAMKAHLVAQNEVVKEALEQQMIALKDSLNKAGVKVEAVEVSVGTHEFERNLEERASDQERRDAENLMQQDKNNQKNGRMRNIDLNNLDNLQGLMSEEEQLVAQIMKDNGNTVNYMA
jgi:flagellar hook-length control protein FliK